ncbi:hypothetical protein C8R45DRAFT_324565 [Mycena sanguinolenta]|nr:hypothetical protein C8R45DRAFT_324565 [Mycena sanguinolenta]
MTSEQPWRTWSYIRVQLAEARAETETALRSRVESSLEELGFCKPGWGRVQSKPGTYIAITRPELVAPSQTPPSSTLFQAISQAISFTDAHVSVSTFSFYPPGAGHSLEPATLFGPSRRHIQIRRVSFPHRTADRVAVLRFPGLIYRFGVGIGNHTKAAREWIQKRAYWQEPVGGWIECPEAETQPEQPEVLLCIMFWKSLEQEQHFLSTNSVSITRPPTAEEKARKPELENFVVQIGVMSLSEEWEGQLKGAGAETWEDEYVDFGNDAEDFEEK